MPGAAPFRQVALNAVTVDETTGSPINCAGYPYLVAYVTGTGTTSSGVITFEEADYSDEPYNNAVPYTGTWSSITTVNASDVTGGAQKAIHFTVAAYGWVRARISTAIGGGGSITVVMRGTGVS